MILAKKLFIYKALMATALLSVALVSASDARAAAGSPQTCVAGSTCVIGEYLYDDTYTPITTVDICTLNAKNPDGTAHITDQNMPPSAQSDGWYAHSFTASATTGFYRAEVCCTVGGDVMCLDKSFEVTATSSTDPDSIASAVWNYSGRTLSSLDSLASAVWNYSTRSLTSFGSLASSVWSNTTRTLTGTDLDGDATLATKSDVETSGNTTLTTKIDDVAKTADENRLLLEKLVNKPIIQNSLEDDNVADLGGKLKDTRAVANQLYVNNQYITSKVGTLIKKWDASSVDQRFDEVFELNELLGEGSDDNQTKSVYGSINWLKANWNWQETDSVYLTSANVKDQLNSSQVALSKNINVKTAKDDLKNLFANLIKLEKLIGVSTDSSDAKTIYGKIQATEEDVLALESRQDEVEDLLAKWESVSQDSKIVSKINDQRKKVLALNKVPRGGDVVNSVKLNNDTKVLKNSLLSMRGLILTNKLMLSKGTGKYLSNSWLEEGSIIIKSLVTNPSKLISQDAEIKYYLPPEITKEEDVVSHDDGLSVKYDVEKGQYYIDGKVHLAINESKIISVKLNDVWVLNYDADRQKAEISELLKALEKTSYYAQGVTFKSEIYAKSDKVAELIKSGITPEERIKAYREAVVELADANEKTAKLKDMVMLAQSNNSLFGFVGGVEAISLWGLILVVITGFVFMVLFMKKVTQMDSEKTKTKKPKVDSGAQVIGSEYDYGFNIGRLIRFGTSFLLFGLIIAVITGFVVAKVVSNSVREELIKNTGSAQNETSLKTNKPQENVAGAATESMGGQEIIRINVPQNSSVNLRQGPSLTDKIILKIKDSIDVIKIDENEEWVKVAINNNTSLGLTKEGQEGGNSNDITEMKEGWVSTSFVIAAVNDNPSLKEDELAEFSQSDEDDIADSVIVIRDTPTGWLRVRENPSGVEIAKVNSGDEYSLLEKAHGWYKIAVDDATSGWVSSEYAQLNSSN